MMNVGMRGRNASSAVEAGVSLEEEFERERRAKEADAESEAQVTWRERLRDEAAEALVPRRVRAEHRGWHLLRSHTLVRRPGSMIFEDGNAVVVAEDRPNAAVRFERNRAKLPREGVHWVRIREERRVVRIDGRTGHGGCGGVLNRCLLGVLPVFAGAPLVR